MNGGKVETFCDKFSLTAGHLEGHSVEWSNPKFRPILDGIAECQSNPECQSIPECQSRVQSKTPAYFGLECRLHSKNFGVPNDLLNRLQMLQLNAPRSETPVSHSLLGDSLFSFSAPPLFLSLR